MIATPATITGKYGTNTEIGNITIPESALPPYIIFYEKDDANYCEVVNLATCAGLKFMTIHLTPCFLDAQNKLFRAALIAAIKTMLALFTNPLPMIYQPRTGCFSSYEAFMEKIAYHASNDS